MADTTRTTDTAAPIDQNRYEDIPATVHDYSTGGRKLAAVSHPRGIGHINAERTRQRLRARGYTIIAQRLPEPGVTE